jgi:hypothetical protein
MVKFQGCGCRFQCPDDDCVKALKPHDFTPAFRVRIVIGRIVFGWHGVSSNPGSELPGG